MNKFEKNNKKNKSKKVKSIEVKKKKNNKNSNKTNIESIEENEKLDKILKNEIKDIINDFKKNDSKFNKNKSINKSSKVKTNRINENNDEINDNSVKRQQNSYESHEKPINKLRKNKELLIKTEIKWYEMRVFDENKQLVNNKISRERINELRAEAIELLREDIKLYEELQDKSSKREDFNWIKTVLRKGTLADKLAAHTILIQDSPVHNLKSLETIIQMVNTKGKRECVMALDNLRELFIGDLLIPNSKLKTFSELINCFDDKMNDKKLRNRELVLCYFEEQLKNNYRLFIDQLVKVSHDTVDNTKNKALITFFDLLVNNGEQEQYLLENLINKLGDPLPKLAAQTSHLLNQLINQYHPLMKSVVVGEVERLLYRPNISQRAQYYGLCFLSEVIFSSDDKSLANKLIGIYFGFFKACVKKGDINNKMMSVLLTGVTRAFPYSKLETNILEEHLQTFYKIIHFVNLNTSIQALMLIFNIIDVNQSGLLTDRFYSVLYRHILEPQLDNCSRKAMFLNLIYRALKRDPILRRVRAFIKRLLQVLNI
jgi:ribosome biogenesis protein MAK21